MLINSLHAKGALIMLIKSCSMRRARDSSSIRKDQGLERGRSSL